MDTAAAAAAAVVVDLSAEGSKSAASKLLIKPKSKPPSSYAPAAAVSASAATLSTSVLCTHSSEHDITNCLGSNVESMSATPPATPSRTRLLHNHADAGDGAVGLVNGNGNADVMPKNGLKDGHSELGIPELIATLNTTTSTSSINASTKPTSTLLTAPATAATTTATAAGTTAAATITTNTQIAGVTTNGTSSTPNTSSDVTLLRWQDMPQYLQFNPYVLRGYRPLQNFKGCLLSLFYWHNETVNILTHAIPIFYILYIVPGLMRWDSGYKFLSFCHMFGSVAPWCGSFVYHVFMNIEKGETVYHKLLKLDMIGIWVSQSFGALPLVTATTLCFPPILKWFIIISYCVLSLWGLYKALTASSPWQRRLCFALPFAMRSVLTFMRIRGMVGGSHMALSHVYLQDGVSILGGAIGAMRIPEKWFPGLVDFYLNSHNIMHVLVVVAVYSMHKATIKDFEWMSTQTCNSLANATEPSLAHMEL